MSDDKPLTLEALDARISALEALQEMTLRLLATTKPLDNVLEHYGATQTQQRATYVLLDDLAVRAKGKEHERPSFAFFEMKLWEIYPSLRNDREFLTTISDTLKVERAAYRGLHAYMVENGWCK
jgi:hypothetical protein